MDFQNLSIEEILAHAAERRAFAEGIAAQDSPTLTQIQEAEAALAEEQEALDAAAAREAEQPASADALAALRQSLASEEDEPEEEPAEELAAEETEEAAEEVEEEPAEVEPEPVQARSKPKARGSRVATLARKVERPKAPEVQVDRRIVITAAAEVPNFASGAELSGMDQVAEALVNRVSAFPTPQGHYDFTDRRYKPDFRFSGVAKIKLAFEDDLTVTKDKSPDKHMQVLAHAADETRLESDQGKGSLVAAGGWCTPSENLYDLCEGETLDGLVSLPEVSVDRGGINFTKGPDFATLFADPDFGWFKQTEAQAEAGTTKPCFELTCPNWDDVRLDAVGLCLRVPILTNAAFPELTQRITRGAMVAHQHKMNADVIARMVTLAGAAEVMTIDYTSTSQNLFANLARLAEIKRQRYMLGFRQSMEIVLPFWVREAIRDDLAFASNRERMDVGDEEIDANFRVRRLNVQWVADWQALDADTNIAGYPNTVNVLMYPAGAVTKGVSDVINVSAVYDAASLAENVYTGLFFEQGLLVANTCYDLDLITVPLCNSGRRATNDVSVCGVDTTP